MFELNEDLLKNTITRKGEPLMRENHKQNPRKRVKKQSPMALTLYLLLLPGATYAMTASSILNNITYWLTNSVAKVVAILTIIVAGLMCLVWGKLHKEKMIAIIIGVVLIFAAASIVNHFTSGG